MTNDRLTIRAADHLIDLLVTQGTTHVFGVPGESFLPVLDALHGRQSEIQFVTCRQEGGAAMAADAHGKLTGRPGICMVTRGPGATNASAGLHVAFQGSTPMILFIGQVARGMTEREAFQEIDYRRMFGQMAKWIVEIDDPARLQEFICRAFRTALSGRPGPVVVSLPEDMLYHTLPSLPPPRLIESPRYQPSPDALEHLRARLSRAERPLVIAGGSGWTKAGMESLARFADVQNLPVAASFRSQGLIDNDHPNYVGHFSVGHTPYLADALKTSDMVMVIGARLGEMTTAGYTLIKAPVPEQSIAHVYPSPEEPGRVFEPEITLVSDVESFCRAVATWPAVAPSMFEERNRQLRAAYETFNNPDSVPGDPLAAHFSHLNDVLPADAILCNGAGNYSGWLHRFYRYRRPGSQLAPTSGTMGYGLPGGVAAAITSPEREVYVIAGDGCFMMTLQEIATACHYHLQMTMIVVNNNRFGTIRAHQERAFPGRVSGTDLTNPDFCALARSFGAGAAFAEDLSAFKSALDEARHRGGVNLIEIPLDAAILAPGKRLS